MITSNGIDILPAYITPNGILTGTAKLEYTLEKSGQEILKDNQIKNTMVEIERKRKIMQEKIAVLMINLESEIEALNMAKSEGVLKMEIKI